MAKIAIIRYPSIHREIQLNCNNQTSIKTCHLCKLSCPQCTKPWDHLHNSAYSSSHYCYLVCGNTIFSFLHTARCGLFQDCVSFLSFSPKYPVEEVARPLKARSSANVFPMRTQQYVAQWWELGNLIVTLQEAMKVAGKGTGEILYPLGPDFQEQGSRFLTN